MRCMVMRCMAMRCVTRCMPMRYTSVRNTPTRGTSVRGNAHKIHAHEMHSCERQPHKMHPHEVDAYKRHAPMRCAHPVRCVRPMKYAHVCKIYIRSMLERDACQREIYANVHACKRCKMHGHEMHACERFMSTREADYTLDRSPTAEARSSTLTAAARSLPNEISII